MKSAKLKKEQNAEPKPFSVNLVCWKENLIKPWHHQ